MAKITDKRWVLAEDLFKAGKSLAEINSETAISRTAVSERSKKYGWIKGENEHLVIEAVELAAQTEQLTAHLTEQQTKIHNIEVNKMLRFKGKLDTFSDKVMKKANTLLASSEDGHSFKAVVDGVDKLSVTVGYNKRFAAGASVNVSNTNAQQNNGEIIPKSELKLLTLSELRELQSSL